MAKITQKKNPHYISNEQTEYKNKAQEVLDNNKGSILYIDDDGNFLKVRDDIIPQKDGRCIKWNSEKFAELYIKFNKKRQSLKFVCWYIKSNAGVHSDYIHHCNIIDTAENRLIDMSGGCIKMFNYKVWYDNNKPKYKYEFDINFISRIIETPVEKLLNTDGGEFHGTLQDLVIMFANLAFNEMGKGAKNNTGNKNIFRKIQKTYHWSRHLLKTTKYKLIENY
jgi:hypothetical protein